MGRLGKIKRDWKRKRKKPRDKRLSGWSNWNYFRAYESLLRQLRNAEVAQGDDSSIKKRNDHPFMLEYEGSWVAP